MKQKYFNFYVENNNKIKAYRMKFFTLEDAIEFLSKYGNIKGQFKINEGEYKQYKINGSNVNASERFILLHNLKITNYSNNIESSLDWQKGLIEFDKNHNNPIMYTVVCGNEYRTF